MDETLGKASIFSLGYDGKIEKINTSADIK